MGRPLSHFTYMALSPSSSYKLLAVPPPGLPVGRAIWIRAVLAHSAWRLDTTGRKNRVNVGAKEHDLKKYCNVEKSGGGAGEF